MPDDDLPLRPATRRRPSDAAAEPAEAPSLAERLDELQEAAGADTDDPAGAAAEENRPDAEEAPAPTAAVPPEKPAGKPADGEPAEEPPAKAVKKAVKKAPAKKAPAKAGAQAAPRPAAKKAPAKRAPAKKAAAAAAGPVHEANHDADAAPVARLAPPAVPRVMPADEPPAPRPVVAETPGAVDVVPPRRGGGLRALMILTVVLLAAAVGMGAAAGVLSGTETWESTAAVRVGPSQGGTPVSGLDDYRYRAAGLTTDARGVAGVPEEDVRADLAATVEGAEIRVTAAAAHADQAELLAATGAERLVSLITRDQQESVPLAADRLRAEVSAVASEADRTEPSVALAAGAGGLTAAGVLLLGLLVVLRPRKSAR